jgi:hypothetical protein
MLVSSVKVSITHAEKHATLSTKGLKRDNNKLPIKFEGGNYDFDIKHK